MGGALAHMGEMRNAHKILVGNPEGKRPHGRHWHTWEDNIRMDFIGKWGGGCGLDSSGSVIGTSGGTQKGLYSMELVSSFRWRIDAGRMFLTEKRYDSSSVGTEF
jgi:hypothetical protein